MQKAEYHVMYAAEETHWWFLARRRFIEAFLAPLPRKNLRIVDIGAGTGGMTAWLKRVGTVVGIEPSSVGRSLAKKRGITLHKGSAEKTGLPTGSVDVVTLLDVLYHRNVDEAKALAEAYRILRPGGTLLVTDCAFAWLAGKHHDAVFGERRYTLGGMLKKLRKAGFTTRRGSYTFFLVFPFVVLSRLAEPIFASSEWRNYWILGTLCRIESRILRHLSLPWGSSIIVRAQK